MRWTERIVEFKNITIVENKIIVGDHIIQKIVRESIESKEERVEEEFNITKKQSGNKSNLLVDEEDGITKLSSGTYKFIEGKFRLLK